LHAAIARKPTLTTPACHFYDHAKSTLAVLSQSDPMTVHVLSIGDEPGRTPDEHSALKTT